MEIRWLGWAGVEIAVGDATVVVDPLADAGAVFAPLGEEATRNLPEVVPPTGGAAVAGCVTHLHRDHADAAALRSALAPGAPLFEPGRDADFALAHADAELDAALFDRHALHPGQSQRVGDFTITALPAVDGIGDPQLAWLVEAEGKRVLHLGDTIWHGYWWRMKRDHGPFDVVLIPVNGAVLTFPHRKPASPFPGALSPDQAAVAAGILGAELTIPIHFDGYEVPGVYMPVEGAAEKFADASSVDVRILEPGDRLDV